MRSEMPVPPQFPIVTFFDPNKADRGLIEIWTSASTAYQPLDIGAPHPNTRDYPGFRLGLQDKIDGTANWIRRVWVTDETSPDWFNFQIKYAAEATAFPTFVRQYREDKKTYTPRTKGTPLTSVIKVVVTDAGTGYIPPPSDPASQGVGPFPQVSASGTGTGFVGHAIVNFDGTVAEIVIDDGGTGYTSAPTLTVDAPPSGTTATADAYIQPQTAYLIAEQAEEFPKDSEFFGLYFNVTRVYETIPGPPLVSAKLDEKDGVPTTITTTRKLCSSITTGETLVAGVWTRTTKKETEIQAICEEVVTVRAIPGFPMASSTLDSDGVPINATQTYTASAACVTEETLIGGVWTRKYLEDVDGTELVSWQWVKIRTIPGPVQPGEQTGKWGVEPVSKQKVAYGVAVDEGYLVRESKVEREPGSNLVGTKITVNYPTGLYGVALQGQDYDPRLDTVIPYINVIRPQAYGIGVNREDITPIDYQHADVRTIDPAIVQAVLSNYLFSYPGRINVDLPDKLTSVYGVIQSSTSAGADQQVGTSSLVGSGSISQSLTAQAQASANILPEAYPVVKQFWGNNIACSHYHFFLPNPVTLTDVLNKLNTILSPSTVSNWPKYNPEIVTLVMYGERASVQSKAQSQGSYATSGSGTASTAGGGVGYSEERGLTIKTLRISPTIHAQLTVQDSTSGTETVTSTAYAEAAGLGPLESQTTGPKTVSASITPTTIPATVGSTDWPTTGLFLYRTDPHPYRYGYIEFHCVVVDAANFPNN